jgi:ring-1,2-phenylacetyl-CoA epoxidase subunit PaaB
VKEIAVDTQWPRYQVFLQEKAGEPYQDVGSVHAPDAEMALQNARDVFARRPDCAGLWVVPADAIFSMTSQQLEGWQPEPAQDPAELENYLVFCKRKSAGTATFIGQLSAGSHTEALRQAVHQFPLDPPPFTWWVLPSAAVVKTEPDDLGPMFDPAYDKPFRHSSYYHVISAMRAVRKGQQNEP